MFAVFIGQRFDREGLLHASGLERLHHLHPTGLIAAICVTLKSTVFGQPLKARTFADRERWVLGKTRIGERHLTQIERGAAGAPDDPRVNAARAQAGAILVGLPGPAGIVHHETMFISEALTRGVRVKVQSEYSPDQSAPSKNQWFFLYTVTISNESAETVQLLTRHWIITDGTGHIEEVRGPGVVGKQPTLKAGESFEYTSGCPLSTPFGVMHGSYQMVTQSGERFDAKIAPFTLSEPYTVH
jgi:ApaG protein